MTYADVNDINDPLRDPLGNMSASLRSGLRHMLEKRTLIIGLAAAKHAGLTTAVDNFEANHTRIRFLANLPVESFSYGIAFHMLHAEVRRENPEMDALPKRNGIEAVEGAAGDVFRSKLNHEFLRCIKGERQLPGVDSFNYFQAAGVAVLGERGVGESIEAYNASLIIQAWTMFEILSEDLWNAALAMCPLKVAQKSGSFRSLKRIKESYEQSFASRNNDIMLVLNNPWLEYLAAVRNILIHKNGKVDQEYWNQTESLKKMPEVVRPPVSAKFPISGTLACLLTDYAVECGVALIVAGNDWILTNK
jgi:hypothetical protein